MNNLTPCPQCGNPMARKELMGLCPECMLKAGLGSVADDTAAGQAARLVPPEVSEIAPLFPQLEVLEPLGCGGMGAVYKARQKNLDRFVALKILPPDIGRDPAFAARFTREAKALAKLSHTNIVTLYEFGQAGELFYFLMEYVDGVNLGQLLRSGRVSPREALAIVPQICDALQYAHDAGIVHRDIKPENILLDRKGRVKVADFGLAKLVSPSGMGDPPMKDTGKLPVPHETTHASLIMGTPQYMAPEQVAHPSDVDHRADIYSLGVVFYQMLTGELPKGDFAPPSKKVFVDVRLDEVVLRALEKKPELRYQQVSDVKTMCETIASTPPTSAETNASEILDREGDLDIGSCLRRGWTLVRGNFWSIVGVTALLLWLLGVVGILGGPLVGGLCMYYLKKIRGEPACVETAFEGCRVALLQLFLAGLVGGVLTLVGLPCLILPGVILAGMTIFALALVIDKQLDYRPALKLSGKTIMNQWKKLFTFMVVLALLCFAGVLAFGVGLFLTAPIALASLMYAYEDIFGPNRRAASKPPPQVPSVGKIGAADFRPLEKNAEPDECSRRLGKLALRLSVGGPALVAMLIALRVPTAWPIFLLLISACEIAALVLGILGWKSGAGKVAVIIAALLPLLAVLGSLILYEVTAKPMAVLSEIENVEVREDTAVVKQRTAVIDAMSVKFGPTSNRWDISSAYFDHLFDVTLQGRWFDRGANWIIKPRHTIYVDYSLDGPLGPMVGKIVFHPGTPASEADGYYVIGEFRPEKGEPLPIAVKLVRSKPAPSSQRSATTNQPASLPGTNTASATINLPPSTSPRLQFRLVADAGDTAPVETLADPNDRSGRRMLRLRKEVLLDESAVARASVVVSPERGVAVEVDFNAAGGKRFAEITGVNIGKRLAVVFDGNVLSAPTIVSVIHDKAVITGKFTVRELAEEIAKVLNVTGKLPPPQKPAPLPGTNTSSATINLPIKSSLSVDQVLVEDLALRMLVAIREKDDATLRSLATDKLRDWHAALPQFALEVRERFQQHMGKPFEMYPAESLVKGDRAVVRCTGAKQVYLVLYFVKTPDGWRNWMLRNSPLGEPLKKYLDETWEHNLETKNVPKP